MSNNLLSKRINNYFEKLVKQNNTPKSGGGIYESFIKPNALMIFLLIIVITIIICYCFHNANNLNKKDKSLKKEEKEFINHIDKDELVSIIDELSSVNERQKIMQDEIDYKMNYLNQMQMEKNNIIIENNEKDKFVSNYKSLGNYQEINNRDKILTKVDDINVEAPYV